MTKDNSDHRDKDKCGYVSLITSRRKSHASSREQERKKRDRCEKSRPLTKQDAIVSRNARN